MSGSLGSLVVEIGANVARWTEDAGRLAAIAEINGKRMEAAFNIAGNALKSIVVGAAALETFNLLREGINKSIEASAGLVQLAERTGATVENLSALAAVARLSGTDQEELAGGLTKLAKSMADAADGGAKTTAAFKAIGISVKDLRGLQPDAVFLKIAQQMALFADGTGKTVAATELLGKSGARLLPTLKDLGDIGQYNATTTEAQARAAEEYEKNLRRLGLASDSLWRTVSAQLVPVFDSFAKAMLEAATSANGLKGTVDQLAADNSIRTWAENGAKAIAVFADVIIFFAKALRAIGGSFQSVAADIGVAITAASSNPFSEEGQAKMTASLMAREKAAKEANQRYVDLWNYDGARISKSVQSAIDASRVGDKSTNLFADQLLKPQVDTTGITGKSGKDTAAALAKALYETQLKALGEFIAEENQKFSSREAALKGLYDDDRISIDSYFSQRQQAINDHENAIVQAYDNEIANAQKYLATIQNVNDEVAKAQRAPVEGKIAELQIKEQIAVAEAAKASIANTRDQIKATEAYADSVTQLSITLAKMRGDLAAADVLEEGLYKKQLARQIRPGDTQGAAIAAALAQTKAYDDQITEQQKMLSQIEAREATVEGRIALQQQEGAIGGFQALAQMGKAREAEIAQLERVYQEYVKIAETAEKGPQQQKAQDDVDALRLKIDQLKATADPLGKTFSDAFQSGFISNLDKVIKGTETVGDAFRNMALGIVDEILQIEEKNLAMALFGSGTGGTSPWVSAFAAAFAGSASGGNVQAGGTRMVGERGPELFTPHSDGYITPTHDLGKQQQNITISPQIINVHDPSEIPTAMQSGRGEQAILNVISRNPSAIKNMLR